jgi:hypothetical protein
MAGQDSFVRTLTWTEIRSNCNQCCFRTEISHIEGVKLVLHNAIVALSSDWAIQPAYGGIYIVGRDKPKPILKSNFDSSPRISSSVTSKPASIYRHLIMYFPCCTTAARIMAQIVIGLAGVDVKSSSRSNSGRYDRNELTPH